MPLGLRDHRFPRPAAAAVLSRYGNELIALLGHLGVHPAILVARPGSTVKPILACLAASTGLLQPHGRVACDSEFESGFHCFAAHGSLSLPEAIALTARSNCPFLQRVCFRTCQARRVGTNLLWIRSISCIVRGEQPTKDFGSGGGHADQIGWIRRASARRRALARSPLAGCPCVR